MNPLVLHVLAGTVLLANACQSTTPPAAKPAVLVKADAATMDRLKTALSKAMGRVDIQLGPGDPTRSPEIAVLPRPPGPAEDRSLARPTIFRLEIEGADCFVARENGGVREKLDGVACRAAG